MGAIRTFVAIDIPSPVQKTLAAVQHRFLPLDLKASWVRPDHVHLTLKFLGEIDSKQAPEISGALAEGLRGRPAIPVSLGAVGIFPPTGAPRVLWVGLEDSAGALDSLQQAVETALAPLGFPPEKRRFSPHLTLARIKSPKGARRLREAVRSFDRAEPVAFQVEWVTFYQSQLTPKGSIYSALERFPLTA